jgi:lysyl-tRNA synthetase class 2
VWQPTASLSTLQQRASLLKQIRLFFENRGVLEVETPTLCHTSATDPLLQSFETKLSLSPSKSETLYLQTSPEFPMKRLVAAGYGSIYQICKVFRHGEIGRKHNPEFTLLELYRVGFTYHELMDEIEDLLSCLLGTGRAERISYRNLFEQYCGINPHHADNASLMQIAKSQGINFQAYQGESVDTGLDLLLTHLIEPHLGISTPLFVYDYPRSQAALAKIRKEEDYEVGERFELYYKGVELANGYDELTDSAEQKTRFEQDNTIRQHQHIPTLPIDNHLLNALPYLPKCAGVALGIDRLICLALNKSDIAEVISFPIDIA